MAYQIFCLLFVRTTGTDLQHDLQHGLQHDLRKLKNHGLFELSVQSIIDAQYIRQGTIFCDFVLEVMGCFGRQGWKGVVFWLFPC